MRRGTATALAWCLACAAMLALAGARAALAEEPSPGIAVYAVSHGWHTGILVPAAELEAQVPALRARFPGAAHYEVGWGDRDYYPATETSPGLAVRAAVASRGAVLQVVAIPAGTPLSAAGVDTVETCLAPAQYRALARFVADSFERDAGGGIVPDARGLYGDSQFYRARGRFGVLNNCNRWTARAFGAAGMTVPGVTLTARAVMATVRANARRCAAVAAPDRQPPAGPSE